MYYVYVLQSLKDFSYYIGFTKNIEKRILQHNRGKSIYTKAHKPYKLITFIIVETITEAREKEKYFKNIKNAMRVIEIMGSPKTY